MYSTSNTINKFALEIDDDINPWVKEQSMTEDPRYLNSLLNLGYQASKCISIQSGDSFIENKITVLNELNKKQIELYNNQQLSNIKEVMLKLSNLHSMVTSNTSNTNESIRDQYQKIVDVVANITGKTNKSAHQGQIGENYVLNILKDAYPKAIVDLSVSDAHQADIHMSIESLPEIFIEVKNYTNTVPSKEVEKFKNDLERNNINLGLFLSFGQKITGKYNKLDVEQYGEKTIIFASCLEHNPSDVILSLETLLAINTHMGSNNNSINIVNNLNDRLPEIIEMTDDLDKLFTESIRNLQYIKDQRDSVLKCMDNILSNSIETNSRIRDIVIDVRDNIVSNICEFIELPDKYKVVNKPDFTHLDDKVSNILSLIFNNLPKDFKLTQNNDDYAIINKCDILMAKLSYNKSQTKVKATKIANEDITMIITSRNISIFMNLLS